MEKYNYKAKLVRVVDGEVYDVVVDLRRNSKTFGQYESFILTSKNNFQLWVPRGFAHGFQVVSKSADFLYKCTDYYDPMDEGCLAWDDQDLDIKLFRNESHKGLGFNYFATAHKASGKYYLNLNGDAVEPLQSIRTMVNNIGKADIITCHHDFNCRSIFYKSEDKQNFTRRLISRLFVITINLITFNNMKYYNGPTIHLLENVKLYKKSVAGMGYQAELITYLLTLNKTYKEILVETIERKSGTSKAVTLNNIINVSKSIMRIFFNQILYIIKKIIKRN